MLKLWIPWSLNLYIAFVMQLFTKRWTLCFLVFVLIDNRKNQASLVKVIPKVWWRWKLFWISSAHQDSSHLANITKLLLTRLNRKSHSLSCFFGKFFLSLRHLFLWEHPNYERDLNINWDSTQLRMLNTILVTRGFCFVQKLSSTFWSTNDLSRCRLQTIYF